MMTHMRWSFGFLVGVLVVLAGIPPSQAQQQVDPGVLMEQQRKAEEERKKREEITQPKPPPEIGKPTRPRPSAEGERRVKVTQFTLSGNTIFKTKDLQAVIASAIGRELTVRELNEEAGKIAEYYAANGYILAQAYLPPQQIRGGVVEIAILEGKIGKVEISGNQRYKTSTILWFFKPIQKEGIIRESSLETALNELNDFPGLKVRANLKPGETRATTDVELRAKERLPYTSTTDVNNYGSHLTGPVVYSEELGIGNLAGLGDNLTLKGSKSVDRLLYSNIGYLIPVTNVGTKLKFGWVHSELVIGSDKNFGPIRPVGRADILSADILQTLTRTGSLSVTAVGGFDFKTVRNIFSNPPFNAVPITKDELRVFHLGVRGDYRDPFLGRTYFDATAYRGVDFWGASKQNAPQTSFAITNAAGIINGAGPGNWTKGTLDVARYQSLGFPFLQNVPVLPKIFNDSYLILRGVGQIASDRLLSPERFAIGGYYTVRGYPIAERIGDNGYAVTAEMVVPVPSSAKVPFSSLTWKEFVQVAAFIDYGYTNVSTVTFPAGQGTGGYGDLTGAGGGLRFNVPFGVPQPVDRGNLAIKVDWASAIGRPLPSSRDQGLTGFGFPGVLYVSAALRF